MTKKDTMIYVVELCGKYTEKQFLNIVKSKLKEKNMVNIDTADFLLGDKMRTHLRFINEDAMMVFRIIGIPFKIGDKLSSLTTTELIKLATN